jgi:hypothetical protein
MSQQSWTKCTHTKSHRLWDKMALWNSLSLCDKPSKFTRSECHNLGWTDNPSTLRRNVTVVNCHSRQFVRWTLRLGRNVTWSVRGWTDHQGTLPHEKKSCRRETCQIYIFFLKCLNSSVGVVSFSWNIFSDLILFYRYIAWPRN